MTVGIHHDYTTSYFAPSTVNDVNAKNITLSCSHGGYMQMICRIVLLTQFLYTDKQTCNKNRL